MAEENNTIKKAIIDIVRSSSDMNVVLNALGNLLVTLRPIENADEIILVCDASIICANKIGKTEMIAQFFLMKARAEMSKPGHLIHEMKNLTLALGWFAPALKVEKDRYEELDKKVNDIWKNVQMYLNTGFEYLKKNPYVGPTAYCYHIAGEVYASFYLQLKLYCMGSGRPWRSKIGNYKIVRFLNMDDLFILDKASRKRVSGARKDCLRYFKEAIKYFKQEKAWKFLADCYLGLAVEHHSFNSPLRCKIAIYRAEELIKKHKISELQERLVSTKSMPLIGSDRD